MAMLSDGDLCATRAEFERLLSSTCVISRSTSTSDGMGGSSATWAAAGTVCCRVSPLATPSGRGDTIGGASSEIQRRVVTFPAETDVRLTDRLEIDGQTLEITDLRGPRTDEFVRRVEAKIV